MIKAILKGAMYGIVLFAAGILAVGGINMLHTAKVAKEAIHCQGLEFDKQVLLSCSTQDHCFYTYHDLHDIVTGIADCARPDSPTNR